VVHHGWSDFLADNEKKHRKFLGPLDPMVEATVQAFIEFRIVGSGHYLPVLGLGGLQFMGCGESLFV